MKQIFDEEKYFKKIDELCTITRPIDFDKIHLVTRDDGWLKVHPKGKVPDFYEEKHFISARQAVELIEKGQYVLNWWTGAGTKETIIAVWMMNDAAGVPYLKHWTDLVCVYADSKEPLVYNEPDKKILYKGNLFSQLWCYQMANAILGLENHDDVLQKVFSSEPDWKTAVKEAKERWINRTWL